MEKELNITVTPGADGLVTIKHVQGLDEVSPVALRLVGNIKAVNEFIRVRKSFVESDLQNVLPGQSIVSVDRDAMDVTLFTNPNFVLATTVIARLLDNPDLKAFGINEPKIYNREQFVKLLKFNKRFFYNQEVHAAILKSYQAFTAGTQASVKSGSDDRGNKAHGFEKLVTTNVPAFFDLKIPIFKDEQPVTFQVEICLDVSENSVKFWLESVQLIDLTILLRDELLDLAVIEAKELGLVVIYK